MKRILIFVCIGIMTFSAFSQSEKKADVLVEVNGKEHKGTVKEITENSIKFVHKGETLTYTLKNFYLQENLLVKLFHYFIEQHLLFYVY